MRSLLPAALLLASPLLAQEKKEEIDAAWIRSRYTKHEFRIPMRDGVRLFIAVYTPKDTSKTYPILFRRTPYSLRPYGPDNYPASFGPSDKFAREGYVFAVQDVRGRWMSEGDFEHVRPFRTVKSNPRDIDESTDVYDTIDWLVKNVPNNNGCVGMWGISYPGFYTTMGALSGHPALKAVSPQAPVTDWFLGDDWHHNGVFFLAHAFNFMINFEKPHPGPVRKAEPDFDHGTPNGYKFFLDLGSAVIANEKHFENNSVFWNDLVRHSSYDSFWEARNASAHLKNIQPAMLTVGGWFDAENLYGALQTYRAAEKLSPSARNLIVMGPWWHGQWGGDDGEALGSVRFDAKTAEFYRENIIFPFFEHHLKQKSDPNLPEAWMFETGRNQWRRFGEWPPKAARQRTLFFHPRGRLAFEPPKDTGAHDEYLSDPNKPVPVVDYPAAGMTKEYMADDQRFASQRPDVLVYETEPLEEDVTFAGPLTALLQVSTTASDADFVVKLIDVYPDDFPNPTNNPKGLKMGGYQQLVRGEPFRGRFRNGFAKAEPFTPGQQAKIEFELPDVLHTFRREHRIMVQVQSSWFPLTDRNPQQFIDVYTAKEADYRKATHRVYHSSSLSVRVLPWQ